MPSETTFLIVGAGLAGATAAATLREEGFAGRIRLIGSEAHAPYIRPPLSKGYLSGKETLESVFVHPEPWYAEQRIELESGTTVTSIDSVGHRVALSNGEDARYDRLLLTTGSRPRILNTPGAGLDGVHYLRTLDDSTALREKIAAGGLRVVLIGSGWIGMEIAATARQLGNDVTVLDRGVIPLSSALGDELGAVFGRLHADNGVVIRHEVAVTAIVGDGGRATGLDIGGEIVPADLVLIGVGAVPNVELAEEAGIAVANGILTDASLQTSSADIFAAGDVANAQHPVIGQRLRSEHWANALKSGPVAARSMLGQGVVYDEIPYFYTDQFDLGMEYSGYAPLAKKATVVYRGDVAAREFVAFWQLDGRIVAGMNVNVWDVNEQVQALIREQRVVDAGRLADPGVELASL